MPRLRAVAPVLHAPDVRPLATALETLGFRAQGSIGDPPTWASLVRDGVELMLVAGDVPAPAQDWCAYVWVEDVDSLYGELSKSGADLVGPPVDKPYECREFEARLPDGRRLVFAQ